jgi:hypothetical protein
VVDDMMAGDRAVLVVHDQHHVGLVGQRGIAPQVVDPHALRLDAFGVGGDNRQHHQRLAHGQVLQAFDATPDLLLLTQRVGVHGHLLQVVDHHHQRTRSRAGTYQAAEIGSSRPASALSIASSRCSRNSSECS